MNESSKPEKKPTARRNSTKTTFILIIFVLFWGAMLYGIGLSSGKSRMAVQKADYEQRVQTVKDELAHTNTRLAATENRASLMQASAALYRSAADLGSRNFGSANSHLQDAAKALGHVTAQDGLKLDQIQALEKTISKTDINVATDLEGQRASVLEFASQLDALIPQETKVKPEPESESAKPIAPETTTS